MIKIFVVKYIELFLLIILALVSDVKFYKIKNKIVFPFMLVGIVTNIFYSGINGMKDSGLGLIIPVLLLIILYAIKMLGAGDIKLFSAVGSIMGAKFIIYTMAFSFVSGGVIAFILILIRKNAKKRLIYLFEYLKACFKCFTLLPYSDFEDKSDGAKFHFAIAIVSGTVVSVAVSKLL